MFDLFAQLDFAALAQFIKFNAYAWDPEQFFKMAKTLVKQ